MNSFKDRLDHELRATERLIDKANEVRDCGLRSWLHCTVQAYKTHERLLREAEATA